MTHRIRSKAKNLCLDDCNLFCKFRVNINREKFILFVCRFEFQPGNSSRDLYLWRVKVNRVAGCLRVSNLY